MRPQQKGFDGKQRQVLSGAVLLIQALCRVLGSHEHSLNVHAWVTPCPNTSHRGDNQAALSLQLWRSNLLSELQSMNWAYSRLMQGRGKVGLSEGGILGTPQQAAW